MAQKKVDANDPMTIIKAAVAESSQRQCAKRWGVSPQYLSEVLGGSRGIGDKLLKGLGLERVVVYRPLGSSK